MKTIRRISQIAFFGLFLYLIAVTVYPLGSRIPVDLFLRLDPLVAGASMLAGRVIIPGMLISLAVVGITLLLGRVFCGWICPLGTTLDAADVLLFRKKKRQDTIQLHRWKYYLLAGLGVTALFSTSAVYLLDPISLITRTVTLAFVAPVQLALRYVAESSYAWSDSSFRPLASVGEWLSGILWSHAFISDPQIYYRQGLLVLMIFVGIVALNSLSRRFWCRSLCPLGALLGLLSYAPILKRFVGPECNDCAKCVTDCKVGAIPADPRLTRSAECVECFNCVAICPEEAISYRFGLPPRKRRDTSLNLYRRRLLLGAVAGVGFAALVRTDPGRKRAIDGALPVKLSSPVLIRAPGAVPEDEFVGRCTRCAECMKVCPTTGLQPALHEAGIEGFWTPILVPRIGYCTEMCNLCGEVCPTDSIQPFEIEEKKHIFIGLAVIDRSQCIAWYADRTCLVCDEYCSYKALEWKEVDGMQRPFINEKKCVGCGICEGVCPIQPVAAIRVFSHGDKRHMTREEQKEWAEQELE